MIDYIKIEGMGCDHCVTAVRAALEHVQGIEIEDVTIGAARVRLLDGDVTEKIDAAIREAGYEPISHSRA